MARVCDQRQGFGVNAIDKLNDDKGDVEEDANGKGAIEVRRGMMVVPAGSVVMVAMMMTVVVMLMSMVMGVMVIMITVLMVVIVIMIVMVCVHGLYSVELLVVSGDVVFIETDTSRG